MPLLPLLSVFSNIYLMAHLNILTWYRFFIWMAIGFLIYFSYGIVKSVGYLTLAEKNRLRLDIVEVEEENDDDEIMPTINNFSTNCDNNSNK